MGLFFALCFSFVGSAGYSCHFGYSQLVGDLKRGEHLGDAAGAVWLFGSYAATSVGGLGVREEQRNRQLQQHALEQRQAAMAEEKVRRAVEQARGSVQRVFRWFF